MPRYDFTLLSDRDFEELCRDLLQERHRRFIESFKSGRDQGIDLRFTSLGDETIVQCKHYVKSGLSALKSNLKDFELGKVRLLSPRRYILVTSVGLTPNNKAALRHLLHPYVRADSDIVGQDDLNNMLGQFPHIERDHFKLWLSSVTPLSALLNKDVLTATSETLEQVRLKMQRFVENRSVADAFKILERGHVLIISGPPGIGKTTLAEMLLVRYSAMGYKPIRLSYDLREGLRTFSSQENQFFFFDDFLGQVRVNEGIVGKTDARIQTFVSLVASAKSARLVCTTREYILRQAQMLSERLSQQEVEYAKYVLEVGTYTKTVRAKILYNHMYFSELPAEYKQEIARERFYKEVIEHSNFHPRLVEWIADLGHLKGVKAAAYQNYVRTILRNPERLWEHAFYRQISTAARHLLIVLAFLPDGVHVEEFELAFARFHQEASKRFGMPWAPFDFIDALKELEGSFILLQDQGARFLNPSVRDFLESVLRKNQQYVLVLARAAASMYQFGAIWRFLTALGTKAPARTAELVGALDETVERLFERPQRGELRTGNRGYRTAVQTPLSKSATILLDLLDWSGSVRTDAVAGKVLHVIASERQESWEDLVKLLRILVERSRGEDTRYQKGTEALKCMMLEDLEEAAGIGLEGFADFWDLMVSSGSFCKEEDTTQFIQGLKLYLEEYSHEDVAELDESGHVADYEWRLKTLSQKCGVDVSSALWSAAERREELELREEEIYEPPAPPVSHRRSVVLGTATEDGLIDDMFQGLGQE